MIDLAVLWVAVVALTVAVSILLIQVRELRKRLRTFDDGVWFSNKLSNLEWRIEHVEPVKQRETMSLDDYRMMRGR